MPNRPPLTKKLLLVRCFRHIKIKYRREFALALLSGDESLPAHWLNQKQRHFVHLTAESTVDADVQADALELATRADRLGDLVFELIEASSKRFDAVLGLDLREQESLREGKAPLEVCKVILHNCEPWPTVAPVDEDVRSMIDTVVCEAVARSRAEQRRAATAAPTPGPRTYWQFRIWHKTRATDDDQTLFRYLLYETFELLKVVAIVVTLGALYVAIFLALYHAAPDMTVHQDMIVAGAGIVSVLGGSGLVLARQLLRPGGPRQAGPQGGASGSDGAP
ncbi:hypothetical protein HH310_06355 [Actinoplanes sp. TBRC 11911]|uniref:hypothetical protein n=1 Tax=Actinoplanes sp. TBRC 11911 TaxID=2729386 RepID=UPI00145CA48D|nr:hypothetical protein [Actinoplanes sp. TBRC 11911]NMO50813.1 hypothetical protein [Actinoplanes sp. TBRC 11911]